MLRVAYPNISTRTIADWLMRAPLGVYQHAMKLGLRKSAQYMASDDACRLRRGDEVGKPYRYPKGHVPANKGLRRPGWSAGRMRETQFKKGRPASESRNYKPIGSLRITRDGQLERKVTDDPNLYPARRWVSVQRLVWEAANGPIPARHIVRFKDGMYTVVEKDITLDKLELVSMAENMKRNTIHNLPKPLKQVIQLRGALRRQINKRDKSREQQPR